jgi:hypothetical protein
VTRKVVGVFVRFRAPVHSAYPEHMFSKISAILFSFFVDTKILVRVETHRLTSLVILVL